MISILISLLILCLVVGGGWAVKAIADPDQPIAVGDERLDRAGGDAPVEPRRRQSAWPPRRNQEPEP